jgi:hypothetical protein
MITIQMTKVSHFLSLGYFGDRFVLTLIYQYRIICKFEPLELFLGVCWCVQEVETRRARKSLFMYTFGTFRFHHTRS